MANGNLQDRVRGSQVREINQIARSANLLAARLSSEEQLRRQWAGDVAHDLRTPLAALRSQLEAMADGVLEASPERLRKNLGELDRMEALVHDLAELTRLESPELELNRAPLDPAELVVELAHRFERRIQKKSIHLDTEIETGTIRADRGLLFRALSNILDNAVRYTPEAGTIRIRAVRKTADVVFSVFNTGKNLSDRELEQVFDRLYRGEFARSTSGSGLGLTIVRRVAQLHGGNATMLNVPGEGVRIDMTIQENIPDGL
jgi:two-component system sensor histidine kinase BaeS